MLELIEQNNRIVYIDCDLIAYINMKKLQAIYQNRTLNVSIAEKNTVNVADGIAANMKIICPFFQLFFVALCI